MESILPISLYEYHEEQKKLLDSKLLVWGLLEGQAEKTAGFRYTRWPAQHCHSQEMGTLSTKGGKKIARLT